MRVVYLENDAKDSFTTKIVRRRRILFLIHQSAYSIYLLAEFLDFSGKFAFRDKRELYKSQVVVERYTLSRYQAGVRRVW